MEIKDVICYTIIRKGDDYGFKGLERTAGITDSSSERTEKKYPEEDYNIFVFGSYIRKDFEYGKSDIDLVLYCPDFKKRDKIASFLETFFKEFLPCDILQYFYSPNATIFYPAITGGMPLTDYYPDELVGELYYLRRYYSKEQAEKKDYARHLRWYEIFLKAGMLNQEGGETKRTTK